MHRRATVLLLVLGALIAGVVGLISLRATTPGTVKQAAREAWAVQGCPKGERFISSGSVKRLFPGSKRAYGVRCEADNPTGLIATIGLYDQADLARRDAQAYKHGGACATTHLAIIGFFYASAPNPRALQVNTSREGVQVLCAHLKGAYIR